MGKRREWPEELAKRCRAVGWTAELAKSGHYKVQVPASEDFPDGGGFSIASTPGSRDGERKALNNANRYGLERLELQARLLAEKERLERIERDRRENGVPAEDFAPPYREVEARLTEAIYSIPNPESENAMQTESLGRIEVEGRVLEILEEAQAWFQPNRGGEPRLVPASRELLLSDHGVYFQCLKGTGTWEGDEEVRCDRLFTSAQGVFIHQGRVHKAAEEAAQRMQPHPDSRAAEVAPAAEEAPEPEVLEVAEPGLVARMVSLGDRFEQLCSQVDEVSRAASILQNELQALARELPGEIASEEMRHKAARFDRMMEAIES